MDRSPPGIRTDIPGPSTTTQTEVVDGEHIATEPPVLRLQLQRPKSDKEVAWRSGTIDNEDMVKKKSKCCCIYNKKTHAFGESSSEDEDECENCFGHVEKRKNNRKHDPDHNHDCPDHPGDSDPKEAPQ